jgi:hypothetical protein
VATGFQVIARLNHADEVHKLYINESADLNTPVYISVEKAGEYQVSVFAVNEAGIVQHVAAEHTVMVNNVVATAASSAATETATATSSAATETIATIPLVDTSPVPSTAIGKDGPPGSSTI